MRPSASPLIPIAVAFAGIALFSAMDAYMKGITLEIGAFSAMLWRLLAGIAMGGVLFLIVRPALPGRAQMKLHLIRGAIAPLMAVTFFFGIARVPLAEGIALSFIAPLITLYLAAVLLNEEIGSSAIIASLLGLAGVGVILAGKLGEGAHGPDYWLGVAAVLVSALFYAWNIILQRQQAMHSSPVEIIFFQHLVAGVALCVYGLLLYPLALAGWEAAVGPASETFRIAIKPPRPDLWLDIVMSAALALGALGLLAWAYARQEAQVLVPVEYTAFIWASAFGWLWFDEALSVATLFGTALIVAGCIIAARQKPDQKPDHVEATAL